MAAAQPLGATQQEDGRRPGRVLAMMWCSILDCRRTPNAVRDDAARAMVDDAYNPSALVFTGRRSSGLRTERKPV